jgi:hydrogenase maturation factor
MKTGKVSESILKRSVLKQLHTKNPDVHEAPAVGADFSVLSLSGEEEAVFSVEPVTIPYFHGGRLGVISALNNVAAAGAKPAGVLVSLLLPTDMNEVELRRIIREIDDTCESAQAKVLGGHTEVIRGIAGPIVTVTGVGKRKKETRIGSAFLAPDMEIVATGHVGLGGTAILATERESILTERLPRTFVERAKGFDELLPVWREAFLAAAAGVCAMHDVSYGGVFGALWEMAASAGVGLEIELKKIPIRQETVEICEYFDLNPYKLFSGGCMLMAAPDGNALAETLAEAQIPAVVIGKTTAGNDRVLLQGEERRFLETAQTDELHKIFR